MQLYKAYQILDKHPPDVRKVIKKRLREECENCCISGQEFLKIVKGLIKGDRK